MSGIYIHIPFCKQACHYCDFHFSTSLKNKKPFLKALVKEIKLRRDYFGRDHSQTEKIQTIYFGGGTPSLLTKDEIIVIIDELHKYHEIEPAAEITLEANPDDLSIEKINELKQTPVNRLSIGIQSFFDEDLKFMNRTHNAEEAIRSVKASQDEGFENITIDLIYGTPTLSNENWEQNLSRTFSLDVPHVSCYGLIVEPKTALHSFIKNGKIAPLDEQKTAEQFEIVMNRMKAENFIHYEICNFCKEGFYSQHNSSYWSQKKYLGLGPSAHSYNGTSRQWNVANNNAYIRSIGNDHSFFESEKLSMTMRYNEYVLTSLRTMWGCDRETIKTNFGEDYLNYFLNEVEKYINSGMINKTENKLTLSDKGKLYADKITTNLFFIDP